jgi:hypothetical protein
VKVNPLDRRPPGQSLRSALRLTVRLVIVGVTLATAGGGWAQQPGPTPRPVGGFAEASPEATGGVAEVPLTLELPDEPPQQRLRAVLTRQDQSAFEGKRLEELLYPVSVEGWWGMVDPYGKVVFAPQWDWCDSAYDQTYRVVVNGWTYYLRLVCRTLPGEGVEADGSPRAFAYADRFADGVAIVGGEGGMYPIDLAGRRLGEVTGDRMLRMSEGTIATLIDGRVGYLDRAGEWRIAAQYPVGRRFHDGHAAVRLAGGADGEPGPWAVIDQAGRVRWADRSHRVQRLGDFRDGRMRVQVGGRWGYLDRAFELAIEPRYLEARPFRNGRAAVRDERGWFLIDRAGRPSSDDRLEGLLGFGNGSAVGVAEAGGRAGLVGRSQRWVVRPAYPWMTGAFRDRVRAGLDTPTGDFLLLDISGRTIFDPREALIETGRVRYDVVGLTGLRERRAIERWDVRPRVARTGGSPPYPPESLEDLQLPQPMLFTPDPVRRVLR